MEPQYRVPKTVAEMLPPKKSSIVTEAANFLRAHWEDVKEDYQVLSGEKKSVHGRHSLDEAACIFKIQEMAKANGFAFLGTVQTNVLRRALRFGFRRNTDVSMKVLDKQYRQLLIEQRQEAKAEKEAEKAKQ